MLWGGQCGGSEPPTHLAHNTHSTGPAGGMVMHAQSHVVGTCVGSDTHKNTQRRDPVTARGAIQLGKALAHRPPGQQNH